MVLVVIGIPAALIGIRNQPPKMEHAPPAVVPYEAECKGNDCPQAEPTARPAPKMSPGVPGSMVPRSPPVPVQPIQERGVAPNEGSVAETAPPALAVSAPAAAPVITAAPPPPPPPPPPAAVASAQRVSGTAVSDVVVTGMRSPAPRLEKSFEAKAGEKQAYAPFLSQLQSALRAKDRRAVTALVAFPLRVNGEGETRFYRDARSIERDFDRIFTPRVLRAVLAQRADRLFVRDQGAMIGTGEIWFAQTCPDTSCSGPAPMRIIAVNPR
jgi:hypothetical protein